MHIASEVFTVCASLGAWPVIVPARMTWLLQVLDTHIFRGYKACIQGQYQDARMCGELDIDRFLKCVYGAIEQTMQAQPWQKAFDENGFGAAHDKLSKASRSHLELAGEVAVPVARPTVDDIRLCFPRGAMVPASVFSRMAMPKPAPLAASSSSASSSGAAASVPCQMGVQLRAPGLQFMQLRRPLAPWQVAFQSS